MTIAAAKGTNTGILNLRLDLSLHINKLDTPVNNAIKSVVMAQSPLDQGYALRNLDAISGGRPQTLELLSNAAAGSDSGKLTNGLHSKISERVEVLESRGDSVAVLRDYESRSIVLRYGFVPAAPIGGTRAMRHTKSEIYNMDTGRQISVAQNVNSVARKPATLAPINAGGANVFKDAAGKDLFAVAAGIRLPTRLEENFRKAANAYRTATGNIFTITSGYRPPARQAAAMYEKFQGSTKDWNIYGNKVAQNQVRESYLSARKNGLTISATIDKMTQVLQSQVNQGIFISDHMKSNALDIRSRDMDAADRTAALKALAPYTDTAFFERRPPHLHTEFTQ